MNRNGLIGICMNHWQNSAVTNIGFVWFFRSGRPENKSAVTVYSIDTTAFLSCSFSCLKMETITLPNVQDWEWEIRSQLSTLLEHSGIFGTKKKPITHTVLFLESESCPSKLSFPLREKDSYVHKSESTSFFSGGRMLSFYYHNVCWVCSVFQSFLWKPCIDLFI